MPEYSAKVAACLPEHLHPVSQQFLHLWLNGDLRTDAFLRVFSLPNSDYLAVAQCLLTATTGA